jgi:hypothetical protein
LVTRVLTLGAACALLGGAASAAALPLAASPVPPPAGEFGAAPPELSSTPGTVAVLRGLDKVTAETRDFEAPVGDVVRFGSLAVRVDYCRKRPPEETPDVLVLLEIADTESAVRDTRASDGAPRVWFSGWMFAASPALNPLEHPVFDIWPMDCR